MSIFSWPPSFSLSLKDPKSSNDKNAEITKNSLVKDAEGWKIDGNNDYVPGMQQRSRFYSSSSREMGNGLGTLCLQSPIHKRRGATPLVSPRFLPGGERGRLPADWLAMSDSANHSSRNRATRASEPALRVNTSFGRKVGCSPQAPKFMQFHKSYSSPLRFNKKKRSPEHFMKQCPKALGLVLGFVGDLHTALDFRVVNKKMARMIGPDTAAWNDLCANGLIPVRMRKGWWKLLVLGRKGEDLRSFEREARRWKEFSLADTYSDGIFQQQSQSSKGDYTFEDIDKDINRMFAALYAGLTLEGGKHKKLLVGSQRPSAKDFQPFVPEPPRRFSPMKFFGRPEAPLPDTEVLQAVKTRMRLVMHALALTLKQKDPWCVDSCVACQLTYAQSMSYLVFHLMETLEALEPPRRPLRNCKIAQEGTLENCFLILTGLFKTHALTKMFAPQNTTIRALVQVITTLLMEHSTDLSFYLADLELPLMSVCTTWLETGFAAVRTMPHPSRLALWDIWIATRSLEIFVQASVAILMLSGPSLLGKSYDTVLHYLTSLPDGSILERQILLPKALSIEVPAVYEKHCRS